MKKVLIGCMIGAIVALVIEKCHESYQNKLESEQRAAASRCPYFVETDSKGEKHVFHYSP